MYGAIPTVLCDWWRALVTRSCFQPVLTVRGTAELLPAKGPTTSGLAHAIYLDKQERSETKRLNPTRKLESE